MSSSTQAKKHSQYESSISLPPISEFSSRFRLPASPPMSIPNKRTKRSIDNTTLSDSSTPASSLGESSVWDMHRSMPTKMMPHDDKTSHHHHHHQQQQQHQIAYQLHHPSTSQHHDQRHRTLSPSPPPTPPLPLPSTFGYYNNKAGGIDANYESGSNATSSSQLSSPVTKEGMSSAQVLAEKRKRNAGASARFRERRKLRERDLQETCKLLDRRVFALESALKQLDPNHSLLVSSPPSSSRPNQASSSLLSSLSPEPSTHHRHSQDYSHTPPSSSPPPPLDHTLSDRVGQLEYMMTLLHQEKITDTKKLASLEKENRHLRTKIMGKYDLDEEEGDGHSIASTSSSSGLSAISRKKSLTPNDGYDDPSHAQ